MAKNKFGSFNIGDSVLFGGQELKITDKIKGNKTNIAVTQGGITTGFKSKPCLYELSNGYLVRGDKIKLAELKQS
jgi:hypothetical protein